MHLTRSGVVLGAACLVACSTLPTVPQGECGNGVIEADNLEDCDHDGADCGAPGTAAACRLLCASTACPTGAVCGQDDVCRAPGQAFDVAADTRWSSPFLLVGDTTGDDLPELVGISDQQIDVRLGS